MNKYDVFKRDNETKLVKCGFSWPALFFNFLWFFYHGMIVYGFAWIFGYLTLDVLSVLLTNPWVVTDRDYMYTFLFFVLLLLPAFYGNNWLEGELSKKGWKKFNRTIKARNIKIGESYEKLNSKERTNV